MFQGPPRQYNQSPVAIAEAWKVDEVKSVRVQAQMLELYYARARDREAERRVAEIRIRAEHRCGEILKEMPKAKGTRGQLAG